MAQGLARAQVPLELLVAQLQQHAAAAAHAAHAQQAPGPAPHGAQVDAAVAAAAAADRALLIRAMAAAGAPVWQAPPPGLPAPSAAPAQELVARQAAAAQAAAAAAAAATVAASQALAQVQAAVAAAASTAPAPAAAVPSGASSAGGQSGYGGSAPSSSAAEGAAAAAGATEAAEVPRCHLHRKLNKVCKYCKAHAQYTELRNKELEDRRCAALERLKGTGGPKSGGGHDDKVSLPNLQYFPSVLRDRIIASNYYTNVLVNQEGSEVRDALLSCDSCEPEVRGLDLDTGPSAFISIVYRLLNSKLTEGQLRHLLTNRNRWVRCAGFVFVRLGVHQDRYWELLSDALLDIEEFVPFPGKGGERMSEGQYVEQLLTKEKYCDLSLPRIAVAQRKLLNERLVLYDQFRKRYVANLEVLDRFSDQEGGIPVEVCRHDGEWTSARSTGPSSSGRRRVTVPVRFGRGGGDQDEGQRVSIGMLICPPSRGCADPQDLTRSRGRSYQDLLERFRAQQRDAAVASGKDYCKNSGRRTVHAGGMTFIAGEKPEKRRREDEGSSDGELRAREARRSSEKAAEHQAKMAAIMEKYCQSRQDRFTAQSHDGVERPDRMRLG